MKVGVWATSKEHCNELSETAIQQDPAPEEGRILYERARKEGEERLCIRIGGHSDPVDDDAEADYEGNDRKYPVPWSVLQEFGSGGRKRLLNIFYVSLLMLVLDLCKAHLLVPFCRWLYLSIRLYISRYIYVLSGEWLLTGKCGWEGVEKTLGGPRQKRR